MVTENTRRIADLQREVAANPGSRQFYQLGELLRRDGQAAEAVKVLRSGLAYNTRYVAAWVSLGRACIEVGASTEAVTSLREALALDPGNPVAWRLLGEAYLALGQRSEALDALTHCLELVPGDAVLQSAVDALSSDTPLPEPPVGAVAPPPSQTAALAPTPVGGGGVSAGGATEPAPLPPAALPADEPFGAVSPPPYAEPEFALLAEPLQERPALAVPAESVNGAVFAAEPSPPEAEEPLPGPLVGFEFEPEAEPVPRTASTFAVAPPPVAPAVPEQPVLEVAIEDTFLAPADASLPEPPASLTLARLYLQQQALGEAVAVLERLLKREPDNIEASDLLALVHDMMAPLPEAPPPLDPRERKIGALQRWLACLTLGEERAER
jgi:Flp pilus assembly protein TadD